jgi:RNA recognition motif-containing protein
VSPALLRSIVSKKLQPFAFMNDSKLFVGNLAYQTRENDLREYFSQAGALTAVNLMLDKFTGKSRGFAFVEYATPPEAAKAIEMFHRQDFQGRPLTVNLARPKEERPPMDPSAAPGDRGPRRRESNDFRRA